MTTLVDTNVLLDIVTDDEEWATRSIAALEAAALIGPLLINDIVYAELSVRYQRVEDVDAFVDGAGLRKIAMSNGALFLAAKAYAQYRRAGGQRTGVLADFFVGAHAAVLDVPLLTRDRKQYQTYFPTVGIVVPA